MVTTPIQTFPYADPFIGDLSSNSRCRRLSDKPGCRVVDLCVATNIPGAGNCFVVLKPLQSLLGVG